MKTSLYIFLLAAALATLPACSAQKRAERHVRKAVALCPELVQLKAYPIDTVLTAPGFTDMATLPWKAVKDYETVYAATPRGTVVVSVSDTDSSLRIGFVAAPQRVRYRDTIHYSQVTLPSQPAKEVKKPFWDTLSTWLFGILVGIGICLYIYLFKTTKTQ